MSYLDKVRRREGRIADALYRSYKGMQRVNVPAIPFIYGALAKERALRRHMGGWIWRKFYDEPLFRRQCRSCGRGLCLFDGIPSIWGGLEVEIGEDVVMHGTSTLVGAKVFDRPRLIIGDRSHCGSYFSVSVGADVVIGSDVLIANRVTLFAYDNHPIDPVARRAGEPADPASSRPIVIGNNAWICMGAIILKGVTIGENAIVAAGAVVVEDVPPNTIVGGNPARVLSRSSGKPRHARSATV